MAIELPQACGHRVPELPPILHLEPLNDLDVPINRRALCWQSHVTHLLFNNVVGRGAGGITLKRGQLWISNCDLALYLFGEVSLQSRQ